MLCGCANPVDQPRSAPTATRVPLLRHGFDDAHRLVVPRAADAAVRRCFSVRVRPSSATHRTATHGDKESLGLGAEAHEQRRPRTLADGATSAIGRILTCFQQDSAAEATSSDDLPAHRSRSRSVRSRRPRSPASCLPAISSGACMVDMVLDCSPGSVRRRRLEAQSVASTSTLHSDPAWKALPTQGSEASSELTATSSEHLLRHGDHPVWELRQPAKQAPAHNGGTVDIPPPTRGDCADVSGGRPTSASSRRRRRVVRRATTCALQRPQVRVVPSTSVDDAHPSSEVSVRVKPASPCPVREMHVCPMFSQKIVFPV